MDAFESIMVPLWKSNEQESKKKNRCQTQNRTNWSELSKAQNMKCKIHMQKRAKTERMKDWIKAYTGNTAQSRATAQMRTANQWME